MQPEQHIRLQLVLVALEAQVMVLALILEQTAQILLHFLQHLLVAVVVQRRTKLALVTVDRVVVLVEIMAVKAQELQDRVMAVVAQDIVQAAVVVAPVLLVAMVKALVLGKASAEQAETERHHQLLDHR